MHPVMAHYIADNEATYRRWPQNAAIWSPHGRPPREGELFVQADLARSLTFMADEERAAAKRGRAAGLAAARDAFYRGDLAAAMVRYHREHGGWLTAEDLAEYRSAIEPPVRDDVPRPRGDELRALVPGAGAAPDAGRCSTRDDLAALGHNSLAYVHHVTEAMKLAFADRDRYYGDPRFVARARWITCSLPRTPPSAGACSATTAPGPRCRRPGACRASRRGRSARRSASDSARWPRRPPPCPATPRTRASIDRHGNVFSGTPSDVSWESPVIPGLGFCPSARGSQSWAVPGHPSCMAPGKRPRLTPNPALARRGRQWTMAFGAPGGDLQPQGMLQVFLNHTVFGMSLQESVEAPRFVTHSFPGSFEPHPYFPARLDLEHGIAADVGAALAERGHAVQWLPDLSLGTAGVCAAVADRDAGVLYGGADPRRAARAMGW